MDAKLLDKGLHPDEDGVPDVPRWDVELHMRFHEAEAPTPVAAVSLFLVEVLYHGMKGMSFTVRDRHSDTDHPTVFVQGGQVCAGGEFGAKLRAAEGSRGRWRRRGGTTLGR